MHGCLCCNFDVRFKSIIWSIDSLLMSNRPFVLNISQCPRDNHIPLVPKKIHAVKIITSFFIFKKGGNYDKRCIMGEA